MLENNDILWQVGELGKVDGGGGGTIAKYVANMNVDVVDLGVPVLSMHAPFEIVSKTDVYMAYRAFFTFLIQKINFGKIQKHLILHRVVISYYLRLIKGRICAGSSAG